MSYIRIKPKELTMNVIDNNIKSFLTENHAGALVLRTGQTVNYGVIRIEGDDLICYTGKGLREIWPLAPNVSEQNHAESLRMKNEEALMHSGYIARIPLKDIDSILF